MKISFANKMKKMLAVIVQPTKSSGIYLLFHVLLANFALQLLQLATLFTCTFTN